MTLQLRPCSIFVPVSAFKTSHLGCRNTRISEAPVRSQCRKAKRITITILPPACDIGVQQMCRIQLHPNPGLSLSSGCLRRFSMRGAFSSKVKEDAHRQFLPVGVSSCVLLARKLALPPASLCSSSSALHMLAADAYGASVPPAGSAISSGSDAAATCASLLVELDELIRGCEL